jgi:putative transposase
MPGRLKAVERFHELLAGRAVRKGESSIWIAQNVERKTRNFTGTSSGARGYFISTMGRDEETIRANFKNQELQDREMDQLVLIP